MSIIISGGYNVFRKQILNVVLKRNEVWSNGIIFGPKKIVISQIKPWDEHHLQIVKYSDDSGIMLLHNSAIIYEHNKLFKYKIDLFCPTKPEWTDENLSTFIDLKYVSYSDLKAVDKD